MSRPLPAGKFDGVDTLPMFEVKATPKPKPARAESVRTERYAKCPGCDRSRGVVFSGDCLRFRDHTHPTTHVACSRSGVRLHDVWDQHAKQPSERRCGCYRG